ncbi:hypothetical protein BCR42DRAFT_405633 [Absidia repens]|uniref:Uncharacterized protein n=1 Tax=Absidia repens TaxID=90262 RepID=A0A1X2ITP5_9FUNG|nr:hypothetical protein BCR42DRAFT_405633 [Absidia repens]
MFGKSTGWAACMMGEFVPARIWCLFFFTSAGNLFLFLILSFFNRLSSLFLNRRFGRFLGPGSLELCFY